MADGVDGVGVGDDFACGLSPPAIGRDHGDDDHSGDHDQGADDRGDQGELLPGGLPGAALLELALQPPALGLAALLVRRHERDPPRVTVSNLSAKLPAVYGSPLLGPAVPAPGSQAAGTPVRWQSCSSAGFPSDVTATNCWVVAPAAGEQCVVIDPGIGVGPQLDEVIAEQPAAPGRRPAHPRPLRPHLLGRAGLPGPRRPGLHPPGDRGAAGRPVDRRSGMPAGTPLFGTLTFAEPDDVRELQPTATSSISPA